MKFVDTALSCHASISERNNFSTHEKQKKKKRECELGFGISFLVRLVWQNRNSFVHAGADGAARARLRDACCESCT